MSGAEERVDDELLLRLCGDQLMVDVPELLNNRSNFGACVINLGSFDGLEELDKRLESRIIIVSLEKFFSQMFDLYEDWRQIYSEVVHVATLTVRSSFSLC